MSYTRIMNFCAFFILGLIFATIQLINRSAVPYIYVISIICIVIGLINHFMQKNNYTITDTKVMVYFLAGAALLGYARYNQEYTLTDKNHLSNFVEEIEDSSNVDYNGRFIIVGKIIEEPEVYYDKTELIIEPCLITDTRKKNQDIHIKGGNLSLQIYSKVRDKNKEFINPDWINFSSAEVYGKFVKFRANIKKPERKDNFFGFDMKEFLNSNNVYARITYPKDFIELTETNADSTEKKILETKSDKFNPLFYLTKFSLNLKNKMVTIIKKTMPYPESAFLGGVTLGLRRGLEDLPSITSSYYKEYFKVLEETKNESFAVVTDKLKKMRSSYNITQDPTDKTIDLEFKWSGVNHVLAVSGLHVTIITVFLFGLFSMTKMSNKIWAPLLVFALIVFTIITGARPSTVRAALMNSIAVITMVYSKQGLRASALFAISTAAFVILINNPLIIYSPSFSLSFFAVLSLVLLTNPIDEQLCKLRGLSFVFVALTVIFIFWMAANKWFILVNTTFFISATVVFCIALYYFNKMNDSASFLYSIGYVKIPNVFRQFISAQFAIQLGMMIPLSAFYFTKLPVAGALANFIAIPLIGIIVQLGIFAGILGITLEYIIGSSLALKTAMVINASNWLFCKAFLWLAYWFSDNFPYPHMTSWTVGRMVVYYAIICIFIWWPVIKEKKDELYLSKGIEKDSAKWKKYLTVERLTMIAAVFFLFKTTEHPAPDGFKLTVLSTGYSDAYALQLGNNYNILINGSVRTKDLNNPWSMYDIGDREVYNHFKKQGIYTINAVILQSLNLEYSSGLIHLAENADIRNWYSPVNHDIINSKTGIKEFYEILGDNHFKENYTSKMAIDIYENYMTLLSILEKKDVKFHTLKEGVRIADFVINNAEFRIECLNPLSTLTYGDMNDNSAVLKIRYGKKSIMLGGNITQAGIDNNLAKYSKDYLKSDVLIAPGHGFPLLNSKIKDPKKYYVIVQGDYHLGYVNTIRLGPDLKKYTEKLTELVKPETVILSYGTPYFLRDDGGDKNIVTYGFRKQWDQITDSVYEIYKKNSKVIYNTDVDKAIRITSSDGESLEITTLKTILMNEKMRLKQFE